MKNKNIYDFQTGDEVYVLQGGYARVESNSEDDEYPLTIRCTINRDLIPFRYDGYYRNNFWMVSLFHIRALTFDERDRIIAIDYNYRPDRNKTTAKTTEPKPKREPKLKAGKLCLVRDSNTDDWIAAVFVCKLPKLKESEFRYRTIWGGRWRHCIPYKGNEHLLNTDKSPK